VIGSLPPFLINGFADRRAPNSGFSLSLPDCKVLVSADQVIE